MMMSDDFDVDDGEELESDDLIFAAYDDVAVFLPYYRAEQTLRRDMMRLARAGWLVREGGQGARRGYRVA
jgi:hypothetical protein